MMTTIDSLNDIARNATNKMNAAQSSEAKLAALSVGINDLEGFGILTGEARVRQKRLKIELKKARVEITQANLDKAAKNLAAALSGLGVHVNAANQAADSMPLKLVADGVDDIIDVMAAIDDVRQKLDALPGAVDPDYDSINESIQIALLELEELLDRN